MSGPVVTTPPRRQLLQQLLGFRGAPSQYWQQLVELAAQCLQAELVMLYWWAESKTEAGQGSWKVLAHTPGLSPQRLPDLAATVPAALLQQARADGAALGPSVQGLWQVGVAPFRIEEGQREVCLVAHFGAGASVGAQSLQWLSAFSLAPLLFERDRAGRAHERDAIRLAHALETVGRLLQAEHFDRAALVLANDLAERFACETVSVCWKSGEGLKLRAISHAEKVDRRSELSALVEEAAQEALTQETEIAWPARDRAVHRAHDRYAALQKPGHIYTLPLVDTSAGTGGEGRWGAVVLERQRMPFTAAEQWALRLHGDMALWPLLRLDECSRALPRRLGRELLRSVPASILPRTLGGRRLAQVLLASVALLALLPWRYSVDAGATVKTDTMAFVGAPFDGYLESSSVQLGDRVQAGKPLFALASRELMLERASLLADLAQASREAEKRRTANQLPEMQMAEAQMAQAEAKLKQVDQRLQSAVPRSPIDGVVVEGEPGKNLGGAVRRGDVIVKVAALSSLYVEAAVSERDLSRVALGQTVRLALLAQPATTYELAVERIIPSASVQDGENTFPVRLKIQSAPSDWWRPGMTGVAKISVGWRPLGWIATHRLADYLRLRLWF